MCDLTGTAVASAPARAHNAVRQGRHTSQVNQADDQTDSELALADPDRLKTRARVVGHLRQLHVQLAQRLQRRLATESANVDVLRRLAETQRMLGNLAAAEESYGRLAALDAGPGSAWNLAVLAPGPLPTPPSGTRAVPFARIRNFLTPDERRWLFAATPTGREGFQPAQVGEGKEGEVKPALRNAFVVRPPTRLTVRRWFLPKLRAALPQALARLGTDNRGLRTERAGSYRIELNVTVHQPGGYYQAHRDGGYQTPSDSSEQGRGHAGRKISYVYYFNRKPRRFAGGDLLLHDTDYDAGEDRAGQRRAQAFTRLAPIDNSLILFPSDSLHEITQITSAGGEPLDFADGRFTVNGWIRGEEETPEGTVTPAE